MAYLPSRDGLGVAFYLKKKKQKRTDQAMDNYSLQKEMEETVEEIRQKSLYNDRNRARIDNNQFFEKRSNPLSSKGEQG